MSEAVANVTFVLLSTFEQLRNQSVTNVTYKRTEMILATFINSKKSLRILNKENNIQEFIFYLCASGSSNVAMWLWT